MSSIQEILIVEDDTKKISDIRSFFNNEVNFKSNLTIKKSFRGGLKALRFKKFDLIILDMTIPKWEDDLVGDSVEYESFGGFNLLKEMKRKSITTPTILITMFREFGSDENYISLSKINELCEQNFTFYLGLVYYSSGSNTWINDLKGLL
ncbi:response regulator [Nonlabens xiamenensis]|uniref:response regulator n=1 Tax=Nonlabens xiamenensis TaxID=2341043 RepID=UPI000F60B7D4|nr:response regulator [Nonlabens xiamenensis]